MNSKVLDGRYRIFESLDPGSATDAGSFEATYLAEDTHLPGAPQCFIRQLRLSDAQQNFEPIIHLLNKKVKILDKLGTHDRIPRLLACFQAQQEFYVVEEFIAGMSLARELSSRTALPETKVVDLLQEILRILVEIHKHNIPHGNVRLSHLLRRQADNHIVLTSFCSFKGIGIKVTKMQDGVSSRGLATLSGNAESSLGSYRADLYAVGLIGVQLLAGLQLPDLKRLWDSKTGKLAWRDLVPKVSPALAGILDRLVGQHNERKPYRSAVVALADLDRLNFRFAANDPASPMVPLNASVASSPSAIAGSLPASPSQTRAKQSTWPKKFRRLNSRPVLTTGIVALGLLGLALYARLPQRLIARYQTHQGVEQQAGGNNKAAIASLTQSIELDPKNANAYYQRGLAYYEANQYQNAADDLTKVLQLDGNHANAYYYRGNTRFQLGDEQGAIEDYSQAIKLDATLKAAFSNRGNLRSMIGDEQGAIEDFNKAIQIDPEMAPAYLARCLSRSNIDDQKGAIEDCTQAIRLDPTYANAYQNRGLARRRVNDIQGAIEDFNVAIQLDPAEADPYYNRGIAREELGDKKGALEDFSQTIFLDPGHTLVYYDRGLTHASLGNIEDAIADFEKAAKLCLDDGRVDCYKDTQYQIQQLKQQQ